MLADVRPNCCFHQRLNTYRDRSNALASGAQVANNASNTPAQTQPLPRDAFGGNGWTCGQRRGGPQDGHSHAPSSRSLLCDAVEVIVSAEKQVVADGSGVGVELLLQPIRS